MTANISSFERTMGNLRQDTDFKLVRFDSSWLTGLDDCSPPLPELEFEAMVADFDFALSSVCDFAVAMGTTGCGGAGGGLGSIDKKARGTRPSFPSSRLRT